MLLRQPRGQVTVQWQMCGRCCGGMKQIGGGGSGRGSGKQLLPQQAKPAAAASGNEQLAEMHSMLQLAVVVVVPCAAAVIFHTLRAQQCSARSLLQISGRRRGCRPLTARGTGTADPVMLLLRNSSLPLYCAPVGCGLPGPWHFIFDVCAHVNACMHFSPYRPAPYLGDRPELPHTPPAARRRQSAALQAARAWGTPPGDEGGGAGFAGASNSGSGSGSGSEGNTGSGSGDDDDGGLRRRQLGRRRRRGPRLSAQVNKTNARC